MMAHGFIDFALMDEALARNTGAHAHDVLSGLDHVQDLGDLGDLGDLEDGPPPLNLPDLPDVLDLLADTVAPPSPLAWLDEAHAVLAPAPRKEPRMDARPAKKARRAPAKEPCVRKGCNCPKSCSKLYCPCYRSGKKCDPKICKTCIGTCCNKVDSAGGMRRARREFCRCKASMCAKKYCECKLAGRTCGPKCGCPKGCQNH